MATAIHEGVPVPALVPSPVIRETSLVAGFGIGASVFALFDTWLGEQPWVALGLGLFAMVCTSFGVRSALCRVDNAKARLFLWSFLPPNLVFAWTVFGLVPASAAGALTWASLIPLVNGVRRDPERHRPRVALWLACAALTTVYAPRPFVPILILAYVLWATGRGWSRHNIAAVVVATAAVLAGMLLPLVWWP